MRANPSFAARIKGCNPQSLRALEAGTRLLQICAPDLKPVTFELVDSLSNTSRGEGGYGSTGK